jgi:hypothetical protein
VTTLANDSVDFTLDSTNVYINEVSVGLQKIPLDGSSPTILAGGGVPLANDSTRILWWIPSSNVDAMGELGDIGASAKLGNSSLTFATDLTKARWAYEGLVASPNGICFTDTLGGGILLLY